MTLTHWLLLATVGIPLLLAMLNRLRADLAALIMAVILGGLQLFGLGMLGPAGTPGDHHYQGTWFRERAKGGTDVETLRESMRLAANSEEASRIVERARTGQAAVESIEAKTERMAPPLLYDLTELQRHANRLYGFSAQQTLNLAQALYERHKLLSYPRTDSRHLSQDVAATLLRVVRTIEAPYREWLAPATGERPLGRRFVDDSKVTDHHAIIPTTTSPERTSLSSDERKIYDMVCRRLLQAWHDDHIWSVTTVVTAIHNGEIRDCYHTSGKALVQAGWKALDIAGPQKSRKGISGSEDRPTEQDLPPGLAKGQPQDVVNAESVKKQTRPPKRFTDATLEGWAEYMKGGAGNAAANARILKDNPDMDQEKIDYALKVMNDRGIVVSGDAKTLGIGAMTDARWASFYKTMSEAGVVPAGVDVKKAYSLDFVNKGIGKG